MKNSPFKSFGRTELALSSLLLLILFGLLLGYYKAMMPYTNGDTAFLLEVVSNLAQGLQPTSEILAQNWAGIRLATAKIELYCQPNLTAGMFTSDPYNWFTNLHAYVILYLIAPIAKILGTLNTLSILMALSFSLIPFVAYTYLRKSGVSIAVSILASIICVIHPAWQISSGGQLYVDRFFIPFALLYALHLHEYFMLSPEKEGKSRNYLFLAILFGVLGGLTSERNMLIVGLFSMGYSLVAQTQLKKRAVIIGFSLLCVLYTYGYMHYVGGSSDNAAVRAGLFSWQWLVYAATIHGIGEYLWFNLIFLVFPAILAPRLFIAVLPIIAINCFITMGGAEKNGWVTHYHSHYFGFLIAAFLIAIVSIKNKSNGRLSVCFHRFSLPFMAGVVLALSVSVSHFYKGQSIYLAIYDYFGRAKELSSSRTKKDTLDKLALHVPVGATVTTPEWGMPAWYLRGNKVNFIPVGIGHSDFVVAQSEGAIPNIRLFSAVRFDGSATLANECIASAISANYQEISRQGTWVLFKKKSNGE